MYSMFHLPVAVSKTEHPVTISDDLYKKLRSSYKKAKYLPEIFSLPPFRKEDQ